VLQGLDAVAQGRILMLLGGKQERSVQCCGLAHRCRDATPALPLLPVSLLPVSPGPAGPPLRDAAAASTGSGHCGPSHGAVSVAPGWWLRLAYTCLDLLTLAIPARRATAAPACWACGLLQPVCSLLCFLLARSTNCTMLGSHRREGCVGIPFTPSALSTCQHPAHRYCLPLQL
jgi:hypothetical protein